MVALPDRALYLPTFSHLLVVNLLSPLSLSRSGGKVLATVYWDPSAQGGVTQQGVVLAYLLSFVMDSQ